ncbi:hypothetical protein DFH08DRAFT_1004829 [Mycena albidolilacea]|uniref:Uncharacterized protein n=1 Tax=Mycena albidolilacea TaxID=1033008 RepID=A0AAD7ASJ6_9AGAR|nr:hypothetical protein DFH08DRAFT_1004829 [Mycena albidolilacea]
MTTDSELTQKLLSTAATYLQVFSTLDPDVIAPIQSETYRHEFAPASANQEVRDLLSEPTLMGTCWLSTFHIQSLEWARLADRAPLAANPPAPRSREEFAAHIRHLGGILRSFPVRAKQTWPNPVLKQVVIWADSETEFHPHVRDNDDEDEGKYRGEYVFILTMDQSGEKIEHVLEFVDSKGTERLRGLMARAWKKEEYEWK